MREENAHYDQSMKQYYKIVIRPVLKYGSKTWALRKAAQNVLDHIWMMGIKRTGLRRAGMIWPCGDKDCIRCRPSSGWTPKDR